jgi:FtsH-binding integral membrane protein
MFKALMITLLFLILANILLIVYMYQTQNMEQVQTWKYVLSTIGVFLFSLFIWFDVGTIRIMKKYCSSKTVNYMKSSFNLVLDIINLFLNLLNMND